MKLKTPDTRTTLREYSFNLEKSIPIAIIILSAKWFWEALLLWYLSYSTNKHTFIYSYHGKFT